MRRDVENRSVHQDELKGATITLSNFGTMAGRYATPIVVPPMVCILGTGVIREEPVAVDGKVEVHRIMPLSLSFDHRAATGGEAARFLAIIIQQLQTV
jgi:pyruvate dehydrogenase E2 component (dihydrolipoamide acetyltransferase)